MDRWGMRVFEVMSLVWGAVFALSAFFSEGAEPIVPYIATAFLAFGATTHLLLRERG